MSDREFTSTKDAEAQAEAERAGRKATRPLFKDKRLILLSAPIVLIGIIQVASGGGVTGISDTAKSDSQPTVARAAIAKSVAAGIGTKVRDGKFGFVVTGVERPGKTLPGKLQTTLTARGEFVIVRVEATNIGNEAKRLAGQYQYLINDQGQALEPSSAMLYTKDALDFVRLINPGETVRGAPVVFDVAPGTKFVDIELHGAPVSQGVRVKLATTTPFAHPG